jgi:hypothetical protein
MKQLLAVFLVLLFYMSPVRSQESASQPTSQTLDAAPAELVTSTNAWTEAINANDRAELEALIAPEFSAYGWSGKLWATRSQWLDNVHFYSESTLHEISPRVYGDFAIVTSVATFVFIDDGHRANLKAILVDTWRRMNGRWQVVTRTICRVSPTSSSTASTC